MSTRETLQVDAVQSGGGVAGGGRFQVATSDGSRIFFTDGNDLVTVLTQATSTCSNRPARKGNGLPI